MLNDLYTQNNYFISDNLNFRQSDSLTQHCFLQTFFAQSIFVLKHFSSNLNSEQKKKKSRWILTSSGVTEPFEPLLYFPLFLFPGRFSLPFFHSSFHKNDSFFRLGAYFRYNELNIYEALLSALTSPSFFIFIVRFVLYLFFFQCPRATGEPSLLTHTHTLRPGRVFLFYEEKKMIHVMTSGQKSIKSTFILKGKLKKKSSILFSYVCS